MHINARDDVEQSVVEQSMVDPKSFSAYVSRDVFSKALRAEQGTGSPEVAPEDLFGAHIRPDGPKDSFTRFRPQSLIHN